MQYMTIAATVEVLRHDGAAQMHNMGMPLTFRLQSTLSNIIGVIENSG
jgi:hypothetical protein